MKESDSSNFQRALSRLCAGFNVPLTDARRDAFWRSFGKLSVLEFAGLIDLALVESTFTELPTVGALWELHRRNSEQARAVAKPSGPTLQEQLCEYAAQHVHDKDGPKGMTLWEYSRPWTYVYREWTVGEGDRAKKCAECIGLVIELDDGRRIGWSVKAMLEDTEGHAKVMRHFHPGPLPTEAQMQVWSKAPA